MDIAIVGCGISGLASALFFHRNGHSVTLFERFERPSPIGSGLVIQPVGQAVLADLGVLNRALGYGHQISSMVGLEAQTGRRVLDVDYDPVGKKRFGLAIHRASLFHVLYEAVVSVGIAIVCDTEISGISTSPKRSLICKNGNTEGPFDLVVDAAGAHSSLSPICGKTLKYGALWGTALWRGGSLPPAQLNQRYVGSRKMLGLLPVGLIPGQEGQHVTVFWSLPADKYSDWRKTPLSAWRTEALSIWPEFAEYLSQFVDHDQLTLAVYQHGMLRTPISESLAHVGDAAHLASPQLGQGANMALLDAWVLSEAIARDGLRSGLYTYQRARRIHVAIYQILSAVFTPLYQSDSSFLPGLRDNLLSPLFSIGLVRRLLGRVVSGDLVNPRTRF